MSEIKEYESEFRDLELYDIRVPDVKAGLTINLKFRKQMQKDKLEFKEMITFLNERVKFCIQIQTDENYTIEGEGDCFVYSKDVVKKAPCLIDISMQYDKPLFKKIVDFHKQDCVVFLDLVQRQLPDQEEN